MLSRSELFLSYYITDFCVGKHFSSYVLMLIWYSGRISWINLILSILIFSALFNISRSLMEHQFFGMKENSNSADCIIQSISLSVGSKVQHLWWELFRTPDNTPVLSFWVCQAWTFSTGVGIQLIGQLSLSDCGCTIDSSNERALGSASSWRINEPSRTSSQFSSLSEHGPKASKRAGWRKAVPTVCDWQWRFDSAAAATISSCVYTVMVIPVMNSVISAFSTGC